MDQIRLWANLYGAEINAMVKHNRILSNLFALAVAVTCHVWDNGAGSFYAVGDSAPKGTVFKVYVNSAYRTKFSALKQRFYVGKTKTGDVISVQVNGNEVCMGG